MTWTREEKNKVLKICISKATDEKSIALSAMKFVLNGCVWRQCVSRIYLQRVSKDAKYTFTGDNYLRSGRKLVRGICLFRWGRCVAGAFPARSLASRRFIVNVADSHNGACVRTVLSVEAYQLQLCVFMFRSPGPFLATTEKRNKTKIRENIGENAPVVTNVSAERNVPPVKT
jgi:hypothetical protein